MKFMLTALCCLAAITFNGAGGSPLYKTGNKELARYVERVKILHHLIQTECPMENIQRPKRDVTAAAADLTGIDLEVEKILYEKLRDLFIECKKSKITTGNKSTKKRVTPTPTTVTTKLQTTGKRTTVQQTTVQQTTIQPTARTTQMPSTTEPPTPATASTTLQAGVQTTPVVVTRSTLQSATATPATKGKVAVAQRKWVPPGLAAKGIKMHPGDHPWGKKMRFVKNLKSLKHLKHQNKDGWAWEWDE